MALQSAKCPNCGANIEVDELRDSFYCSYCGSQVQRDSSNTFRIVDVAKIKEIESNERLKNKEMEIGREANNTSRRIMIIGIAIGALLFLIAAISGFVTDSKTKKEDQRLQEIVIEIQEDILNEDYDSALLKANRLHMYSAWAGKDKEWDQRREELIELINKKKEEANK